MDSRFKANHDDTAGLQPYEFARSLLRPTRMLVLSPVVSLVSIYVALVYDYIYPIATTLTEVFEPAYHFAEGPVGLTYLGINLGQITAVIFCGSTMDRYMRANKIQGKDMKPEYWLIPMSAGEILTPLGLFIYGWTAEKRVQWMVPIIGTSLFSFGVSVYQIVSAGYLIDTYTVHVASAVAAGLILRYMASLPLAGPRMYNTLSLGRGNSVLGFVALIMVPAPLLMLMCGEGVRSWESQSQ